MTELTDEQIKAEDAFLKGLPRFNIGAFLMPPIWGPAHGIWVTILYYPAWLLIDNLLYATWENPTPLAIILSVLAVLIALGITIAFAIVSQPFAAHRAEEKGVSRAKYLSNERKWAVISAIIAIVMLVLATVYNLNVRPFVGE